MPRLRPTHRRIIIAISVTCSIQHLACHTVIQAAITRPSQADNSQTLRKQAISTIHNTFNRAVELFIKLISNSSNMGIAMTKSMRGEASSINA